MYKYVCYVSTFIYECIVRLLFNSFKIEHFKFATVIYTNFERG